MPVPKIYLEMIREREEPKAMKEIHDIRLQIQEETKNMTVDEIAAYYADAVRNAEKVYGVKFRRAGGDPTAPKAAEVV
ncbi:MAG: hypothetical protein LBK56_13745 [Gracilibacteraceae bacterium]|jgi:hypothetical protein|nr:hypothetical protein [Gracilibacteraceae bacterium]